MTKAEKEKAKLQKAKDAYVKFEEGIQIIERTIMQLNATSNESEPICRCVCNLNVTLEIAKQALDYMIQKLNDDKLERETNGGDCYKPIAWDPNPWKCPKEPEE